VVESVLVPGAGGVTDPAVLRKTCGTMIWAFRAGKVLFVASNTFPALIAEIPSRMARRAFL
jgi:hypothetical protein